MNNDNDIIKALEYCIDLGECRHCPAYPHKGNYKYCASQLMQSTLDLINRQKAEIERLRAEQEEYPFKCKVGNNSEIHSKSIQDYDNLIKDIQAAAISPSGIRLNQRDETSRIEAVKEFAERLKKKECALSADSFCCIKYIPRKELDNLVKEMVGEE